ncbi:uncharacterized protein [Narcine bancroftii]|uniref:uncharacterized protein n=1 Tax=Narcine bancroftii TaxID=1343680 RepID=UPI003831DD97
MLVRGPDARTGRPGEAPARRLRTDGRPAGGRAGERKLERSLKASSRDVRLRRGLTEGILLGDLKQQKMPRRGLMQEYEDTTLKIQISGKAFYLDLPDNKSTKFLEDVLKKMGGKIESFLSKEVSYLISNRKEAALRSKSANSASAPTWKHLRNCQTNPSHSINFRNGQMVSRGKRLLEKAIKNNECGAGNSTLANARSWGMKILHLDDLLAYLEKRGARKLLNANRKTLNTGCSIPSIYKSTKVGKLKPPFLKIEDSSRNFKPLYHQFVNYPELNYKSHKRFSAFEHLKILRSASQEEEKNRFGVCRMTDSEGDVETLTKPAELHVERRRHRFCECCHEKFYDLFTHLHSKRHQDFAINPSHFTALDKIMSQLENEFVECQSNGILKRSAKTTSSPGISLSKEYVDSLQVVNNLAHGDEKQAHSVAESQVMIFSLKHLEPVEKIGVNSKLHHVTLDKMKAEPNLEALKHNLIQLDHNLASISSANRIDVCSKHKLLDFSTAEKAACQRLNTCTQEVSPDANKEGIVEIFHQEKQAHMSSASEQTLSYMNAFPQFQKVDCDALIIDNKCSFKKRKRSDDASSQNERRPRAKMDDAGDYFTFFKGNNSPAENFGEYISQPHTELFYLSDQDKSLASTCLEQKIFSVPDSMKFSIGEHFDLSSHLYLDKSLNIKEGLENLQSKNDCRNLVNPPRLVWNCEEKPNYLPKTTTADNQEVSEEIQMNETALIQNEQLEMTINSARIEASRGLLSPAPNTEDFASQSNKVVLNEIVLTDEAKLQNANEEINLGTEAANSATQLTTNNTKRSLGYDPSQYSKIDSQTDVNGCKNSVNFSHLAFKNYTLQTDTFSSESEWDIQLPAQYDIMQIVTKDQTVDVELLRKTCVNMEDAEYETQLYSVLKDKSEVDWINKEGHNQMS